VDGLRQAKNGREYPRRPRSPLAPPKPSVRAGVPPASDASAGALGAGAPRRVATAGALGGASVLPLEEVFPLFALEAVDDRFHVFGALFRGYEEGTLRVNNDEALDSY